MKGWLDFSGAPALLVPARLVPLWRGCVDPATGEHALPDFDGPRTDFDRACAALMQSECATLTLGGGTLLALELETDHVVWDPEALIVSDTTEPLSADALARATWTAIGRWRTQAAEHLLMNAAADGAALCDDEWLPVRLPVGELVVERARMDYVTFVRLRPIDG